MVTVAAGIINVDMANIAAADGKTEIVGVSVFLFETRARARIGRVRTHGIGFRQYIYSIFVYSISRSVHRHDGVGNAVVTVSDYGFDCSRRHDGEEKYKKKIIIITIYWRQQFSYDLTAAAAAAATNDER